VNPGPPEPIPEELRRVLAEIYRDELAALRARLRNRYTEAWLEAAETA
jgi:hypothetical protein